jgi:predicted transposase YbfD/YdcC
MAGKKGTIPNHVKQKIFIHPQDDHHLIHVLTIVEDPRKPSLGFQYSLVSVLFMTLVAVICGAFDWEQIVVACEGMHDWLANYVDMRAGIPCERTFKNIFAVIKPESLEEVLREFSSFLRERLPREVICFDGQTCCGTADKNKDLRGIHLLNAWSARNKICLGQLKIDEKSNEIQAMPRLLDLLDVKGAVITADAMNTQKKTVQKIIEKGADYVLPIKENQGTLYQEIKLLFIGLERENKTRKTVEFSGC